MTLALSVNDFVDKIGAYAGIAAVLGLALFALLLFAQARELRRLREWGAHAHDRIGELERRLAAALELARRAGAAQRTGAHTAAPTRRPAGVPARPAAAASPTAASTRAPVRLPLLPAAPAGIGGPALGSATVLVPLPKAPPATAPAPAAPAVPAATPAPTAAPAPAVAPPVPPPAAAPAAATPPAPATAAAQGPEAPPAPPAPATPPAATNGHSDTFPPVPPVRRAPPARPGARRPAPRVGGAGSARPAPAAPLRARTPSATPRGGGPTGGGPGARAEEPHGRRRLFALLAGLGVIAVVAVGFVVLSGGDDSPSTPAAGTTPSVQQTTSASRQGQNTPAPPHDRTTVAVLNGTTVPGLANTVASELEADGFLRGPVGNASDQARSVTVVSYFGGREREAAEVAETLGVPADAVQAIDADTEASCAASAGSCTATVVVTVGADRQ